MKKIFKNMAWMLAATMAMAACSDSLEESSGNGNSNEYVGDKGYVNIGINLPTTKGNTRAFDGYNDGIEAEYDVNNVIIALFYGENESKAICKHAFKINGDDFQMFGTADDNITTYSVTGVRMISAPGSDNVYALALINAPQGIFDILNTPQSGEDTGDALLSTSLEVNNSGVAFTETLGALNDAINEVNIGNVSTGFFMTNAAIAINGETSSDLTAQILAPISVYNSKEIAQGEAKNNPIYVERAAAKVAVTVDDDNTLTVTDEYPHYAGATVEFTKWNLQNTNKTFYPVRKVDGFDDWKTDAYKIDGAPNRFVGAMANPYRIFWAVDPNYTETTPVEDLEIVTTGTEPVDVSEWYGMSNVAYCAENTTDVSTMLSSNLTSVLLQATFTPKDAVPGSNFFMLNNVSAIYTETEFLEWATNTLINDETEGVKPNGTLTIDSEAKSGIITNVATIQALIKDNGTQLDETKADILLDAAGGNIKFYKGGVTYYYAAVIKHFGEETPYEEDAANVVYDEEKHLGRYGVVRNTWYELKINSVSGPGEPVIPEIPTTPPDKENSYINCEINILSWAKRSQSVDL